MTEEELNAKAAEIEQKASELTAKEEELKAKEEELAKREEDAAKIGATMKEGYEKQIAEIKAEAEERLKQREEVIKQLASGEAKPTDENNPIAELNKKRLMQRAA